MSVREEGRAALPLVLLTLAVAMMAGRVLLVQGPLGQNDLSRWMTVRALAEHGTFAVGTRLLADPPRDRGIVAERGWRSIDLMLHPDTQTFYSSKPPLLSTLVAGEARLLRALFGWRLPRDLPKITPVVLLTFNVLPLGLALLAFASLLGRLGMSERGSAVLLAIAAFATFPLAYVTVLSNHVPAVAAAYLSLWALARITLLGEERSFSLHLVAGFAAGSVAALEPPALIFPITVVAAVGLSSPRHALAFAAPAALLPLLLFLLTSALAFGEPLLFYFKDPSWMRFAGSYWDSPQRFDTREVGHLAYLFHFLVGHHGIFSLSPIVLVALPALAHVVVPATWPPRRRLLYAAVGAWAFLCAAFAGRLLYRELDASLLVGLLPLLALSTAAALLPWRWWSRADRSQRVLERAALLCTLLVVGFYLVKTSNYGGDTVGPRWTFWLLPLWLLAARGSVEAALAHRRGRWLVLALLVPSTLAVGYGLVTPWRPSWLHALFF